MRVAIMQPYLFPYIGYFNLIDSVDVFVVYDNIKYTKKGWVNRNRFLQNGTDEIFTLPLAKGSDSDLVYEKRIAANFEKDKLLRQLENSYRHSPNVQDMVKLVGASTANPGGDLFVALLESLRSTLNFLGIQKKIVVSSSVPIDHALKGKDKVLAICKALGASHYINAIGGQDLYDRDEFKAQGLLLSFIKTIAIPYDQHQGSDFMPFLSILDMIANVQRDDLLDHVKSYELI